MSSEMIALYGTLLAGVATGLGAVPIYLKKEFSKKSLDIGLGFSAGIMLVASFVSLIIPAVDKAQKILNPHLALFVVLLSLLVGYLFIIFIHDYLPHEHVYKNKDMRHDKNLSRMTLIVLAISLHNFPEGLAVGVGFGAGSSSEGLVLAMAIALQNMPEGLVVAIGLLGEGASKNRAFMMAFLSGLVEPIAAALGYFTTDISRYSLPVALGFAGGTMLFVICQEMLPELFRQGHEKNATLGVITGVILMLAINYYPI